MTDLVEAVARAKQRIIEIDRHMAQYPGAWDGNSTHQHADDLRLILAEVSRLTEAVTRANAHTVGNAPLNDGGSSPSTHEATSSNGLTPDLPNEGSETNGLNPNQEQP